MAYNHEINYVRIPGVGVHNLEECVISEEVINGQILCIFELHSRQMIGNIIFYPFLSFILKLNSWSSRIQLIKWGLASFLVSKYFRAA